jgi:DNA-binding beta-propeller fold protein YncE
MMQPEPFEQRLRAYLDERSLRASNQAAVERTLATVFDPPTRARNRRLFMAVVIAVVAALVVATPITVVLVNRWLHSTPTPVVHPSPNPSPGATVPLGGSPGVPAVNPKTGTLYVPIQCPTQACTADSNFVDVINTAKCNANMASDCRVVARATVGYMPQAVAIDAATDTLYIPNNIGSTSVLNGALCNATVTSGCSKAIATIGVGGVDAAFDPNTRTLYVADPGGGVHVIDGATCNALTTAGCGKPAYLVPDNNGPQAVDVDLATDTVYAVDNGSGNGDTVSVIDGATCNGSNGTGCDRTPRTIKVGSDAFWGAVDQLTDTLYVSNYNDGTVSVIDGARCNATNTSGCASSPVAVPTGPGAAGVAVDDSLHTVFAVNQNDTTLSAINTKTCNGAATAGCPKLAPRSQAGSNQGPGYNAFPNTLALLPQSDTAYVVSLGGEDLLAVVNVGGCNATNTRGCRVEASSVPEPEFEASIDPATDTIYASNNSLSEIDVLNGATCNATHLAGCAPVAEIPMLDPMAAIGAVDDATHTLYASDSYRTTVSVINTATCNASDTTGCTDQPQTITVGSEPGQAVLNMATHTLYVPFGTSANEIAVVNAATCNAEVVSGCGETPAVVSVGDGTAALAVSAKTDTIYAPSDGIPAASGDTMLVINGATCNGTDHSGCGRIAATVTVGLGAYGVAVDDATNTVYVANNQNGFAPGTVSVINGATCNGSDIAGCTGHFPTAVVGRSPRSVVVDTSTDRVYIIDHRAAAISVLNGATCNAAVTKGCSTIAIQQAVGSVPSGLIVNQDTNTVYAMTFLVSGSMSIFAGQP